MRLVKFVLCAWLSFAVAESVLAQLENVPVSNPVYEFLKRMRVKDVVRRYNSAVLPLSRKEVAEYLLEADRHRGEMTETEQESMDDFLTEFEYDLHRSSERVAMLLSSQPLCEKAADVLSEKEKYLYAWSDSSSSLFMDFLFSAEHRLISGDTRGNTGASLFTWGGRIRGTLKNRLGYYLQATNGQVMGDKDFALTDVSLREIYKINEPGSASFDVTEGYLQLDADVVNIQLGRERVLWGAGYGDRLILSSNPPPFDFLKLEARIGSVRYTFLHSWILGQKRMVLLDSMRGVEPVVNSKYLASHRVNVSFGDAFDFGVTEMVVYAKRFPELGYLNPFIFYKSVEHSLQDRDNSFLVLDAQARFLKNLEISATLLIDDISFSKVGTSWYGNELAYKTGMLSVEPFGLKDVDITLDYTRIQPYVYSHHLAENNFTNNGFVMGHRLGPNSDDALMQIGYRYDHKLRGTLAFEYERHGDNILDASGGLLRNVGGDFLQGHRTVDSEEVTFLDGVLQKTNRIRLNLLYEPFNEFFVELQYELRTTHNAMTDKTFRDNLLFVQMRIDY